MNRRDAMHGPALLCCLVAGFLAGCTNPIEDPYGCDDRGTFGADDRVLPDAVVGVAYSQAMRLDPEQWVTLVDTAKGSEYGLRFDGQILTGTPTKAAANVTFRWVAGEFGTQCEGRTDTFATQLTIKSSP
ncbi:MAG: hypothetical protein IPO40_18845 [Fibrobacteres bacterium]|nr:hypothetical protein [Fibrobacterota bacterium]